MSENKLKCVDPNCNLHVHHEQDGLCYGRMMVPAESAPATEAASKWCEKHRQAPPCYGCHPELLRAILSTPATEAEGMEQRADKWLVDNAFYPGKFSRRSGQLINEYTGSAVMAAFARAEVDRALEAHLPYMGHLPECAIYVSGMPHMHRGVDCHAAHSCDCGYSKKAAAIRSLKVKLAAKENHAK